MSEATIKMGMIVREELRKGVLSKYSEMLSGLPEILSAVEVDVEAIQKKITNNKNPLNAIFRLFGLQLVQNDYMEVTGSGSIALRNLITIDEEKMTVMVSKMSQKVEQAEIAAKDREKELASMVNSLNAEMDSLRRTVSQSKSNAAFQKSSMAASLQDLISRIEKDNQKELTSSIEELIEDLGYHVTWKIDSADDKRFHFQTVTKLRREEELIPAEGFENIYISKPFLSSEDGESIKGYAYILKDAEDVDK